MKIALNNNMIVVHRDSLLDLGHDLIRLHMIQGYSIRSGKHCRGYDDNEQIESIAMHEIPRSFGFSN